MVNFEPKSSYLETIVEICDFASVVLSKAELPRQISLFLDGQSSRNPV